MELFLSKNEKRAIAILEFLYSEEKNFIVQDIALTVNCSTNSVNESLIFLNRLLKTYNVPDISLNVEKGSIFLKADNYSSVHYLKILTIQESTSYKILDEIFQDSQLTIETIERKLYLSRSTIYRKLNMLEKLLNDSGLKFSKKDLTIIGNEATIREFFYNYYLSFAHLAIWPFKTIDRNNLKSKLVYFQKQSKVVLTTAEELQLTYRLAINTIRYQQKKFIDHLPSNVTIAPIVKEVLMNVRVIFQDRVPVLYQKKEEEYLYLLYVTYPSLKIFSDSKQVKEAVYWHEKTKSSAHYLVSELLNELIRVFPSIKNNVSSDEVQYKLLSVANYALLYPNLNVELGFSSRWDRRFQSISLLSIDQPLFTKVLWNIITTINTNVNLPLINPNHVFYFIYSILSQCLDLKLFEETISVKIILEVGYLIEDEFASKFQSLLLQNTYIVTSRTQDDELVHYDLVISDLEYLLIDYKNAKKKYVASYPPVQRDISNLKSIVEELSILKIMAEGKNDAKE
ncbi:helix-turn-helix domain-containing protein [Vagococcus salmoninarum]|uniref:helix-turn-helix domain-containing protein n=1 Tax=Vagococcus salmoninarum TaxID=2739 RepID=UPI001882D542|nr:helix-turn-helix domain-containing protein [Vagococcus salmoninarum]MBE9389947.1 helix-turn-helix domain-containing protein [Vagococcus salmoninarum]